MWMVVYVTEQESKAYHIRELLADEGFVAKIKSINEDKIARGCLYEILVPQSEVNDIHVVLMEHGY